MFQPGVDEESIPGPFVFGFYREIVMSRDAVILSIIERLGPGTAIQVAAEYRTYDEDATDSAVTALLRRLAQSGALLAEKKEGVVTYDLADSGKETLQGYRREAVATFYDSEAVEAHLQVTQSDGGEIMKLGIAFVDGSSMTVPEARVIVNTGRFIGFRCGAGPFLFDRERILDVHLSPAKPRT
jgi:predicted transcriptional regulator